MKIAILSGEIPAATFIERLIAGLAKQGNSILVLGNVHRKSVKQANIKRVGPLSKYGKLSSKLFIAKYTFLLTIFKIGHFKKFKKTGASHTPMNLAILWYMPEIVHVQWAKGIENFLWVQDFKMKLVASLRGAHINYSPLTTPGLAEIYRTVFPMINGFHGVSDTICKEAAKYGANLEKCKTVYSGFDLNAFPKSNWVTKTNDDKPLEILSVGRSHWKKGYHFALDAFRQLKDNNTSFKYTIIGASGNEELMFQRNQLELKDEVEFISKVPFDEVKERISKADILLLPSVEEGIANVVLEAMLLGTFVISTDCGGMEEVVKDGDTGFVVPVREPDAIAKAVNSFNNLSLNEKAIILEKAYEKVSDQHNEEKMVKDMSELYELVNAQ